jgi:hypothetical protein
MDTRATLQDQSLPLSSMIAEKIWEQPSSPSLRKEWHTCLSTQASFSIEVPFQYSGLLSEHQTGLTEQSIRSPCVADRVFNDFIDDFTKSNLNHFGTILRFSKSHWNMVIWFEIWSEIGPWKSKLKSFKIMFSKSYKTRTKQH